MDNGDRECPDCETMALFEQGNVWVCERCSGKFPTDYLDECGDDEMEEDEHG